jgi:hypothetical protein
MRHSQSAPVTAPLQEQEQEQEQDPATTLPWPPLDLTTSFSSSGPGFITIKISVDLLDNLKLMITKQT